MVTTAENIAPYFRTWGTLHEGQRHQVERIWRALPGTPEDKRAWFLVRNDEGMTRIGRVASGEGDAVLGDAMTEFELPRA
jgi:hypothetical protein